MMLFVTIGCLLLARDTCPWRVLLLLAPDLQLTLRSNSSFSEPLHTFVPPFPHLCIALSLLQVYIDQICEFSSALGTRMSLVLGQVNQLSTCSHVRR